MPYHDPESTDPNMLVGVRVPGSEAATREMAASFADEFAQLGFDRERILALYRDPYYVAPHAALELLGDADITRLVDESVTFWSRYQFVVHDAPQAGVASDLVRPGGFLRMIR